MDTWPHFRSVSNPLYPDYIYDVETGSISVGSLLRLMCFIGWGLNIIQVIRALDFSGQLSKSLRAGKPVATKSPLVAWDLSHPPTIS